ncbi:MAG TPA: hypothetical protein DCO70_02215 [Verrucomicrobiales bacterium]|jgi:hypothetical protein|nr:hypothetical protein [Verrucomicrobiota bacterium]HAH98120.1 hypothetical protein [Verrucomicrobiales bacterium]|tara:strand:- start:39 stop:227 length:189 start_codon:yes stop_codon:yes gene_type:complete
MGLKLSAKGKGRSVISKRRKIGDAIEIAKDYQTDVYWEGEVVWSYDDWARQSGSRREVASAV